MGMNQVEQDGSRKKCMRYKPHNISELSAFIAAIRPGFKSMYQRFENREDFSWGIPSLDNLIRTEELPVSFLFFQEQVMSVLNYAGFPMDVCYGIIKSIAKKHPEKVRPLKQQFIDGFREQLIADENLPYEVAQKNAEDVWTIVNDNCGYGFNCVSGDTKIMREFDGRCGEFTVAELFKQYSQDKKYGTALSMFPDLTIRKNRIVGVYEAGVRETYKVTTENGCSLICTENHRFPTMFGKHRLEDLCVGDYLFCRVGYKLVLSPISAITYHSTEMTYDIEMADPAHTFISQNGLITSNSAHAYSVALDSLYQAWQKANYPYEFYETLLQHYSDKGNKSKVAALKTEMRSAFEIVEGEYKFGNDNRHFSSDKENHVIYPALSSIKRVSQKTANILYKLGENKYDTFLDLLVDMKKNKINATNINILTKLDYFSEFGKIHQLIKQYEYFDELYGGVQLSKSKVEKLGLPEDIVLHNSLSHTAKTYMKVNMPNLLKEYFAVMPYPKTTIADKAYYQFINLGYIDIVDKSAKGCVVVLDVNTLYTPRIKVYALANGNTLYVKVAKKLFRTNPFDVGCVLKINNQKKKNRLRKLEDGTFQKIPDEFEWWITDYFILRKPD